jgi:hypothetical protein
LTHRSDLKAVPADVGDRPRGGAVEPFGPRHGSPTGTASWSPPSEGFSSPMPRVAIDHVAASVADLEAGPL